MVLSCGEEKKCSVDGSQQEALQYGLTLAKRVGPELNLRVPVRLMYLTSTFLSQNEGF